MAIYKRFPYLFLFFFFIHFYLFIFTKLNLTLSRFELIFQTTSYPARVQLLCYCPVFHASIDGLLYIPICNWRAG